MRRAALALALLVSACQTSARSDVRLAANDARPVTFSNQIVRIFQRNCQTCHRPGEVAPFSLTAYKDAHARRDDIVEAVESRYMPPWKAMPGHGEFTDVRRLADDDIRLIARWVADGAPEGDARDLPSTRRFPTGWTLGTPSSVLAMEEPFTVPARTKDIYRCFVVPIRIPGQWRMIRASEVLPGNRKVVHHVQTFLDVTGRDVVKASATLSNDLDAISIHAHMHLLGRAMTVTAHLPDGTMQPMLKIDDWDFEWQIRYSYKRPVPLPAGTRIEAECVYDNSTGNPKNPSKPPRTVTSGFETTDEMCLASVLGTVRLFQR